MMDQDITPDQYSKWRSKAISTLLDSEAGKNSSEQDLLAEIEQLMPMAQEEGWLRMEWFLNIVPDEDGGAMEGIETSDNGVAGAKGRGLSLKDSLGSDYIGLGTMMQEATDYLGERQREDYKRWKAGIMARIEEIEAS
jgi:origin recognition complex subunit 6